MNCKFTLDNDFVQERKTILHIVHPSWIVCGDVTDRLPKCRRIFNPNLEPKHLCQHTLNGSFDKFDVFGRPQRYECRQRFAREWIQHTKWCLIIVVIANILRHARFGRNAVLRVPHGLRRHGREWLLATYNVAIPALITINCLRRQLGHETVWKNVWCGRHRSHHACLTGRWQCGIDSGCADGE